MLSQRVTVESASHRALRDRLLAEVPDLDPETLANTLEGLTDLREVLAELVRGRTDDGDPLFRRMVTTHSDRWRPGWRESAVG